MLKPRTFFFLTILGCAAHERTTEQTEDQLTAGPCSVFSAVTKKMLTPQELASLHDPVAERLLLGESCPENLDEISAKLAKTDPSIVSTRIVNDVAFLTGQNDGVYRAVVTRDANDRPKHGFFVSIFGVEPAAPQLPQEQTELIGWDASRGVLNYYVRESFEKQWVFMGSSKNAIEQGYSCDANGACIPKAAKDARCWACHESGGLNMKELNEPWNNWEIGRGMPGFGQIMGKWREQLGAKNTAIDLERRVNGGNAEWNRARMETLKEQGPAEVLRPLFCTLTVNLQTSGTNKIVRRIQGNMIVNDVFTGFLSVADADYQAAIRRSGQRVVDWKGETVRTPVGPILDTQTPFRYAEKGEIDRDYIHQLVEAGIIDDDFVADVAHVDFTRPIFSKDRCELLSAAPSGGPLTAASIREGFKQNLATRTDAPAAALRKNLSDPNDRAKHQADVDAFFRTCQARPGAELVADILAFNGHQKNALKAHRGTEGAGTGQGIIEFAETLPVDNLPDTGKALDPITCKLQ